MFGTYNGKAYNTKQGNELMFGGPLQIRCFKAKKKQYYQKKAPIKISTLKRLGKQLLLVDQWKVITLQEFPRPARTFL